MKTLCSKANNKLRVLASATPYMNVEKKEDTDELIFQRTIYLLPPYMHVTQP